MNRFELAFFVRNSAEIISIEDYLALWRQGAADWRPDTENATLRLTVDGKEYIAPRWSLGSLRRLAPQLAPAAGRVAAGKPALIRAGVDDSPTGTYFLLEPDPAGTVYISMLYVREYPYGHCYPIPAGSPQAREIYGYILNHRERLLRENADERNLFRQIPYPSDALSAALARQTSLAGEFWEVYGDN